MNENEIGTLILKSAVKIHKDFGPGLLERVYESLLESLLIKQGLSVARQVTVPLCYEGQFIEEAFRADLIVENKVLLEIKSVESLKNAHKKQVLTYLKLTGLKLEYLLNFNESLMKNGITRVINGDLSCSE